MGPPHKNYGTPLSTVLVCHGLQSTALVYLLVVCMLIVGGGVVGGCVLVVFVWLL